MSCNFESGGQDAENDEDTATKDPFWLPKKRVLLLARLLKVKSKPANISNLAATNHLALSVIFPNREERLLISQSNTGCARWISERRSIARIPRNSYCLTCLRPQNPL